MPRIDKPRKEKHGKKERLSDKKNGGVKKPHRYKPGTVALREIRRYQSGKKATAMLIPAAHIQRLVTELIAQYGDFNLKKSALAALRQAVEDELVKQFQCAQLQGIHAGRLSINEKDMQSANELRRLHPGNNHETAGTPVKRKQTPITTQFVPVGAV